MAVVTLSSPPMQQQLEVLCSAKAWYIDGTLKLCRNPFSQLLTINAFVRSDSCAKQAPVCDHVMEKEKRLQSPDESCIRVAAKNTIREANDTSLPKSSFECPSKTHAGSDDPGLLFS